MGLGWGIFLRSVKEPKFLRMRLAYAVAATIILSILIASLIEDGDFLTTLGLFVIAAVAEGWILYLVLKALIWCLIPTPEPSWV